MDGQNLFFHGLYTPLLASFWERNLIRYGIPLAVELFLAGNVGSCKEHCQVPVQPFWNFIRKGWIVCI